MNYQAFRECALMLERSGDSAKANELKTISDRIRQDFNRYLVRDGIVAGYGTGKSASCFIQQTGLPASAIACSP